VPQEEPIGHFWGEVTSYEYLSYRRHRDLPSESFGLDT